jgi:hypothetical protein
VCTNSHSHTLYTHTITHTVHLHKRNYTPRKMTPCATHTGLPQATTASCDDTAYLYPALMRCCNGSQTGVCPKYVLLFSANLQQVVATGFSFNRSSEDLSSDTYWGGITIRAVGNMRFGVFCMHVCQAHIDVTCAREYIHIHTYTYTQTHIQRTGFLTHAHTAHTHTHMLTNAHRHDHLLLCRSIPLCKQQVDESEAIQGNTTTSFSKVLGHFSLGAGQSSSCQQAPIQEETIYSYLGGLAVSMFAKSSRSGDRMSGYGSVDATINQYRSDDTCAAGTFSATGISPCCK